MAYTTIKKPSDYFRTKLYTGNATNDTAITWDETDNMKPDWLWFKNRSQVQSHALFDSTRGATLRLISNSSGGEATENTNLDSFDTNGFTVDYEAIVNGSGDNMVAWGWKANGGTTSSNTDGSTTSTVQADTTSGFSIVKWTGTSGNTTIGHNLGTVPTMVIAKNTGGGSNWIVYHKNLTSGYFLKLNLTNAQDNANSYFTADPTNSILSLTGNTAFNQSGNNMIAYCFADVTGYSKFGSYTGNGSTDGPFIYTGFKPAFVIVKRSSAAANWVLHDNKRDTYNYVYNTLTPNENYAEFDDSNYNRFDFLSNGFKLRGGSAGSGTDTNGSGDTYIYMAFAEEPLVGDNPATAR